MPFLYHITKAQYLENIEAIGLVPRARHASTANSAGATLGTRDSKIKEFTLSTLKEHLRTLLAAGYSPEQIRNARTGFAAFETARIMVTDDAHVAPGGIPERKGILLIAEQTNNGFADYRASLGRPIGSPESGARQPTSSRTTGAPLPPSRALARATIADINAAELDFGPIRLSQNHFLVSLAKKRATIQQDYEEKTSGSRVHFFEERSLPAKLSSYAGHINRHVYEDLAVLQIDATHIQDLRQDPAEPEGRISSLDVRPEHIRVKIDVSPVIVRRADFFSTGWQTLGETIALAYIRNLFPEPVD
jgi:hypothetical protein